METELFSEVVRVQSKIFYVDVKENQRGRYIKIAEKVKYRPKSSIVLPSSGLPQFMTLFDVFLAHAMMLAPLGALPTLSHDMITETKVLNFQVGENQRGRFIRINESGGGYAAGGSSLMFPSGFNGCYLLLFKECMLKVSNYLGVRPPAEDEVARVSAAVQASAAAAAAAGGGGRMSAPAAPYGGVGGGGVPMTPAGMLLSNVPVPAGASTVGGGAFDYMMPPLGAAAVAGGYGGAAAQQQQALVAAAGGGGGASAADFSAAASAAAGGAGRLEVSAEGHTVLSAGGKHFFFEVRSNARGGYLKIKEVSGNLKNLLVLPLEAVPLFQLAIGRAMVAQHAGAGAAQQQEDGGSGGSGGGDADTSS